MRNVDVVAVDDDPTIRRVISTYCSRNKISCKTFPNTRELVGFLLCTTQKPESYFVDMRLEDDMEGPEQLYYFLQDTERMTDFTFMTGNLSEHDRGVIKRTKSKFVLKPFALERAIPKRTYSQATKSCVLAYQNAKN